MHSVIVFLVWLFASMPVAAGEAGNLSAEEAVEAVKQALFQGAESAVQKLGVENGFLDNPRVKITLPAYLQKAEAAMRTLGKAKYADRLIAAMNHAAEISSAKAGPLLKEAVDRLSIDEPQALLAGEDDEATRYFSNASREALAQALLPIVKNATDQAGLLKKYNDFAGKAAKFGLLGEKHAHIENHVAEKMLDGLYLIMAEEEQSIRHDPSTQSNELLQSVFGPLLHAQ